MSGESISSGDAERRFGDGFGIGYGLGYRTGTGFGFGHGTGFGYRFGTRNGFGRPSADDDVAKQSCSDQDASRA